ncbi:MAG: RNA 2',3'-cyclic phosphodiesterase [Candidatus Thermoplasmatota archaeon]
MFRGFIAVDIGAMPEIVKFIDKLRAIRSLKLVEPQNVHLTLKFLGNVDENKIDKIAEIMQKSIEGVKSFKLKLKGAGAFPGLSRPRVLWIGTENTLHLLRIANYLNESLQALGFEKEARAFSSHVTVARVKFLKDKKELQELLLKAKDKEFGEIVISSIRLKKSVLTPKGPEYSTVKEIELKG